ncbi:MAG: hypothetical protein AAFX41_08830 [Bacteroidota bacterium]
MSYMIVQYNLQPDQNEADFERWLRDVDLPGYARMTSMRNPTYYRATGTLDEDAPLHRYIVVIESDGPDAVEREMADPAWAGFIADFEARVSDALYVTAERLSL